MKQSNTYISNFTEQRPSWEAESRSASSLNFPRFVEPEGSLPYSQQSTTDPYPESDENSPHHDIL
jgi:hypothetical protein